MAMFYTALCSTTYLQSDRQKRKIIGISVSWSHPHILMSKSTAISQRWVNASIANARVTTHLFTACNRGVLEAGLRTALQRVTYFLFVVSKLQSRSAHQVFMVNRTICYQNVARTYSKASWTSCTDRRSQWKQRYSRH
jgi:hypothetical protein